MNKSLFVGSFFLAVTLCCKAQSNAIPTDEQEGLFRFDYDNDFFSATDRYYTQGIRLSLAHSAIRHSPFSYALLKMPNATRYSYILHLEQDVFTPVSIRYNGGAVYYGERPFTAVAFLSHTLRSLRSDKKLALSTQLDLGILGPEALGEEEQKGIHKALNNIEPLGWENQLATDVVVNYRARIERGLISEQHVELNGLANLRVGTLYDDLNAGFFFRAGTFHPWFASSGFDKGNPGRKFRFWFQGSASVKAVAYNATLQGGAFNKNSIYTLKAGDISRVVSELMGGIVVSYKRLSLEYSKFYITKEFKNGVDHSWGKCAATVYF